MLQAAMASSERIFTLLDTPVRSIAAGSRHRAQPVGSSRPEGRLRRAAGRARQRQPVSIVFDHVWFAYNGDDYVLRDVSFEVGRASASASSARPARARRRSSTCCCGSTTCTRGRILVDGVDIRELDARGPARAVQPRAAGRAPVLRHDRRQHPARRRGDRRTRPCARGRGGARRRASSSGCRTGYESQVARARRDAVGRAEAAAVVRAGAGVRPARADPRRGDVERRHRDRAADPRRAAGADGRPDDDRDRAPALDHPGHGQDPRAPQGRAARGGHAPGAARAARHLLPALPAAVQGPGSAQWRVCRAADSQSEDADDSRQIAEGLLLGELRQLSALLPWARRSAGTSRGRLRPSVAPRACSVSSRLGPLARGFQPRRRTNTWTPPRRSCTASSQLHM